MLRHGPPAPPPAPADDPPSAPDADAPSGWTGVWLSLALVVLGTVVVLVVPPLREAVGRAVTGDTDGLRDQVRGLGGAGVLVLLALILVHAVVFYPAELVNAAAGYVYGFGIAFPLVLGGWVVSALAAYALGRVAGRPLLHRLAGARRFADAERLIERGGIPMLLAARLIPFVPFSLVGYVAGAARVPVGRYAWTTAVGTVPITAAAVYFGHRLDSLSLGDPLLWASIVLVLALVAAAQPLGRRLRGSR